jgi:hypothetical protein
MSLVGASSLLILFTFSTLTDMRIALLIATLALGLKTGLAAHATVNYYQEAQAERLCQIDPSYCGLKQK